MIASSRYGPGWARYGGSTLSLFQPVRSGLPSCYGRYLLIVYAKYTTSSSESVIIASKVYCSDAKLSKSWGTHYARLDRDVKIRFFEYIRGMILENLGDGDEFSMSSTLDDVNSLPGLGFGRLITLRLLLVSFMPRPMISPLCTKTQPTGVSSVCNAVSACSLLVKGRARNSSSLNVGCK